MFNGWLIHLLTLTRGDDMLPKYYRFRIRWDADQTLTYDNAARVSITFIKWKLSSGDLVYSAEGSDDFGFGAGDSIADEGQEESAVIDNSSDLYWGINGTLRVVADQNSTDGTMYLYLESSTDNSVWPSDQADFDITTDLILLAALSLSTDAEDEGRAKNFSFE